MALERRDHERRPVGILAERLELGAHMCDERVEIPHGREQRCEPAKLVVERSQLLAEHGLRRVPDRPDPLCRHQAAVDVSLGLPQAVFLEARTLLREPHPSRAVVFPSFTDGL